eukprot:10116109-Alexandrium_andersonii.AAC.1
MALRMTVWTRVIGHADGEAFARVLADDIALLTSDDSEVSPQQAAERHHSVLGLTLDFVRGMGAK